MSRRRPALFALLLAPLLAGCPAPSNQSAEAPPVPSSAGPRDSGAFAETDPWLLTTTDPNADRGNHGIFLGNGSLGATFGADGVAGKDAVCFAAGNYDARETLATVPGWPGVALPAPGPNRQDRPYAQTLDLRRGVLTTKSGDGTVTAFVPATPSDLLVLHGEGNVPAPAVAPPGAAGGLRLEDAGGAPGSPAGSWTRTLRVARPGSPKPSPPADYGSALAAQQSRWAALWQDADITIDGDPEAQQLVHKLLFDLLQSTRPGASDSIPPESLSGDFYKGHIFWDAEVWMFPALLAQHPDYARSILDYRFRHLAEAKAIAKAEGCAGADFPWESAATGREVAPGEFSKERHVTADVGWAHWQYWLATQDKTWLASRGWPVLSGVADYWASRAKKGPDGKYHIDGVIGPDELKGVVSDNTYTNAMARYCLLAAGEAAKALGRPAAPEWRAVADGIALPFDRATGCYLARADDDGKPTKQADGELVVYPAALPMDQKTAAATFDFNAKRPIKNGPAMTDSIHALIAARLGRAQEAERYFRDAYRPFVRGPFLLFSEKRSLDRCVFATGEGGVLQAVLYGFGGLDFARPGGLVPGRPALPPSWKKLTVTGIRRGGRRYTLTVTPESRTLTPA